MRKLLTIHIILLSYLAYGQVPEQYIGATGNRVVARGQFKSDSLFILPFKDTISSARVLGAVIFHPDGNTYYYNGTFFQRFTNKRYVDSLVGAKNPGLQEVISNSNLLNSQSNTIVLDLEKIQFNGPNFNGQSNVQVGLNNQQGLLKLVGDELSFGFGGPLAQITLEDVSSPLTRLNIFSGAGVNRLTTLAQTGGNSNSIEISPGQVGMEFTNGLLSKNISMLNANAGIRVQDGVDSVGLYYSNVVKSKAIAARGNNWVPNWGSVKEAIADSLASGSFKNFVTANLTLAVPERVHSFGTNVMKFQFTGLGPNGDGYVSFNESNIPGIVIQGDGDFLGPSIVFKDLALPSATSSISSFLGTIQLESMLGTDRGFGRIGNNWSGFGAINGTQFSTEINTYGAGGAGANRAILVRDSIYSMGMHYTQDYSALGVLNFGNRWIPDWGAVLGAVGAGAPIPAGRIPVGTGTGTTSYAPLTYTDSTQRLTSPIAHHGVHARIGDSSLQKTFTQSAIFYGDSYIAGTTINPTYVRLSTGIANLTNVFEWNRGIGGTRLVALTGTDSSMDNRIYTIPAKTATIKYIVFCYGVNDALSLSVDTATFRATYNKIIDSCIARGYALNEIIILSNGYFIDANPTIQARIKQLFDIEEDLSAKKGVVFVDNYNSMLANGGASLLLSDNVHLNDQGNEIWINNATAVLGGGGTLRVNGVLNSNTINVYQSHNPVNAPYFTGVDTALQTVLEIRAKKIGTNTESIGFGPNALETLSSGSNNAAFGAKALQLLTTGSGNTALGYNALNATVSGGNNTAIGMHALRSNTGSDNTAIGRDALASNTSGTQNTAIGSEALTDNLTGSFNAAIGYFALNENTGSNNTAVGTNASRNNTSAGNNTAVGFNALFSNSTGTGNTAIGYRALRGALGNNNTGIGIQSGDSLTTGINNTFGGYQSGYRTKAGQLNTFFGYRAGLNIIAGNYNTAFGGYAFNVSDSSRNRLVVLADGEGTPRVFSDESYRIGLGTAVPQFGVHVAHKLGIDSVSDGVAGDSALVINNREVKKIALPVISSGRYAPTVTAVLNVDATSAVEDFHYMRIGNEVTVKGMVNVNPTIISTSTNISITLPFAATSTDFTNITGNIITANGAAGVIVSVSNIARVSWISDDIANQIYPVSFTYTIQ